MRYLPAALSQLAKGDTAAASESYRRLSQMSPIGASFASWARPTWPMYFGRYREAVQLLQQGIEADLKNKNATQGAQKNVALAEAYQALGQPRRAADAAAQAAKLSRLESTLFPAGARPRPPGPRRAGAENRCRSRQEAPASDHRLRAASSAARSPCSTDRVSEGIEALRARRAAARFVAWQVASRQGLRRGGSLCRGADGAGAGPQAARRSDRRVPLRPADHAVSAAVVLLARPRTAGARCVG